MSGISSHTGWSSPSTASAAMLRLLPVVMATPRSQPRHHGRASAAHLRKTLPLTALPVEDDPLTASERAIGVGGVDVPDQRPAPGTTAAARTPRAGRGHASRCGEFLRLDDVHADLLEIGDRQMAAWPVCTRHDSTVRRDADRRPPAARTLEVIEAKHSSNDGLRRRNKARLGG